MCYLIEVLSVRASRSRGGRGCSDIQQCAFGVADAVIDRGERCRDEGAVGRDMQTCPLMVGECQPANGGQGILAGIGKRGLEDRRRGGIGRC